ncbi:hypothetical protein [Streptomyces coriariae]|uniref:hypothetical protein n=1 Tax=Streptomyces coriariae TaxID=2864460 RepID=UPI001E5ACE95|nr:hypothetical protein [Streptomyces coriariae]
MFIVAEATCSAGTCSTGTEFVLDVGATTGTPAVPPPARWRERRAPPARPRGTAGEPVQGENGMGQATCRPFGPLHNGFLALALVWPR